MRPEYRTSVTSNKSIAQNLYQATKRFYDWADPVLGPINTGLESLSAINFVMSMSYSDYALCQLDLLKNPDNTSINDQLRLIYTILGIFSIGLAAADGYQYKQDKNYRAYWLTRIKSMLLGMYSGGILSDQALIGIFDITNCPTILASNSAAMLALGGARFVSYTHSNVPVRYMQHLRATNRLDELLVPQPNGKMKILKALASILVAGSTGLAVYHSGYTLAVGDFPPKYGRNLYKLITGLLFGVGGFAATLLDGKYPEAAFRWKQFIIVLSEATLIERGIDAVYDLDNSPYALIVSPFFTLVSLFSAITKANREVPVHRIRQELELQRLNAGLDSESPMTAVHVDVGSPTPISLSPQWAQLRGGNVFANTHSTAAPQTGTLGEPLLQSGHPSEAADSSLSFG